LQANTLLSPKPIVLHKMNGMFIGSDKFVLPILVGRLLVLETATLEVKQEAVDIVETAQEQLKYCEDDFSGHLLIWNFKICVSDVMQISMSRIDGLLEKKMLM